MNRDYIFRTQGSRLKTQGSRLISSVCLALVGWSVLANPAASRTTLSQSVETKAAAVLLTVSGEVDHPLKLTAADLAALPRLTVRAKEHTGEEASFEGIALIEVLKMAGVKFGESLRGKALATYLVVKASDNYQVVFTPPELDPAFTERIVLLADKKNGAPLSTAEGPLRIVVPSEKRQARWVRNVLSISVRHAE
jgi:DMSO/TMAO reductase YedYZ molybdopterin-dependent catalytic subunit